ncbi:SET domain-containing protein [Paraburkholderia steynii]|nr:SET domain-containing protein-lysine N-methyltransferase [Paraburkholderia steynii]
MPQSVVSPVHGKGLFALQPVEAGERLIEYKGEVTSWRRAAARQRSEAGHTFVFGLSDGRVIDGSRGGNSPRFLNHACEPNCEVVEVGEELFIDYTLVIDGEITDEVSAQYACHCGAAFCRHSMLAGTTAV